MNTEEPHSDKEHDNKGQSGEYPWRSAGLMRELYINRRMPISEVAGYLDCSTSTTRKWLNRHGIETRDKATEAHRAQLLKPAGYEISHDGYETSVNKLRGERSWVGIHRLVAVAKYGFDAVCEMHVHHRNEVPWDNRYENIELLTPGDHVNHHLNPDGLSWFEKLRVSEIYRNTDIYQHELAEEFGVSQNSISRAVNEIGGGSR